METSTFRGWSREAAVGDTSQRHKQKQSDCVIVGRIESTLNVIAAQTPLFHNIVQSASQVKSASSLNTRLRVIYLCTVNIESKDQPFPYREGLLKRGKFR